MFLRLKLIIKIKKMSIHKIKNFSIYGLFGINDVNIPFDENVKILIGKNGLGKTQVLNIFYYTLTTNFSKLSEFSFDKVELQIQNEDQVIIISKEDCDKYKTRNYSPLIKDLINIVGVSQFERLKTIVKRSRYKNVKNILQHDPVFYKLSEIFPSNYIDHILKILGREDRYSPTKKTNKVEVIETIQNYLSENKILYFPTFRRVEEDLYNLGYDDEEFFIDKEDTRLIHFGMDDVQKRFDAIERKIDLLLKEGFTKITSKILSKLVEGFSFAQTNILTRINESDLDILLARIGEKMSLDEKTRIREIVSKKEISEKDQPLIYLIQTLIEIYEEQKKFDNSINKFKSVCNKYLVNKQVVYDESNIKIFIQSNITKQSLQLNQLSSGEKQIISIFSTIYLSEDNEKFIVLFDEPELSLSMTWQKKLLPDIVNSGKCDFLLAVTHSPFIFDNELDKYAIGLNEYVKPLETVLS